MNPVGIRKPSAHLRTTPANVRIPPGTMKRPRTMSERPGMPSKRVRKTLETVGIPCGCPGRAFAKH
eukprot:5401356-Lingulodinium_polyedra.AAC.1